MRRLITVEVLGALAILTALGIVTWWMLRLGIKPVKDMTHTATLIAAGDMSVRVPESTPGTEPAELAVALNQMLGRIETALDERAQSEQRLRQFVADASHELRTPITTIRGYAELYRQGGLRTEDELADAMRRTEQEAGRMGRLVDDMLVLAKLDQHRPLETRPVDLAALASDAAADARAAAPARAITLDVPDGKAVVIGDEDRLRQVIANVVGNALVHTAGDVPIAIRVSAENGSVVLEVDDRGPGMAADVAERVTKRFFRADPARSRHRGGSGLGLSIVDAAVSAHGGSVDSTARRAGERPCGSRCLLSHRSSDPTIASVVEADVSTQPDGRRRWFGRRRTKTAEASMPRRRRRRGLAPGGVVTIEYSPSMDGDPDPGEIVWTWVPYEEDPAQGKDRPVVIIGRRGHMLVGVPLTTQRDDREPQVEVGTGDWDSQHRPSYARIWRLFDVDPLAMRREGAILTPDTFVAVVKAVDKYYDVRIPKRRRRRDASTAART